MPGDHRGVPRIGRQIGVLPRVLVMIVELLAAVVVADVAPAIRADGVVTLAIGQESALPEASSWSSRRPTTESA